MSSKMVKFFRSEISPTVSVGLGVGQFGYFFVPKKSKKNKDTDKYEDTPFFGITDVAALKASLDQAIRYTEENPLPKPDRQQQASDTGTAPLPKSIVDDDIPF